MKQKEEEYKMAIKMLISAIKHSRNTDVWSQSTEQKFYECVDYAKEILNESTEQLEHELDFEWMNAEVEDNELENTPVTIVDEPEQTKTQETEMSQPTLFALDEPEPTINTESKPKVVKQVQADLRNDMPFEVAETINDIEQELKQDVEDGLIDKKTADEVVSVVDNESKYYRFENNTLYVLKPEEMNVEVTAKTFFANLLTQEYNQSLADVNIEAMVIDYKNHVFKSLTWTNQYGVRFNLVLEKYVNFLEKYVLP